MATSVSLVCMPWHVPTAPSIQLGILQAVLRRHGIACHAHSFHLDFLRFATAAEVDAAPLTRAEYLAVGEQWFVQAPGAWVFAPAARRRVDAAADCRYLRALRRAGLPPRVAQRLQRLRARVPAYLSACADEVLATGARVVGFTTTFGQTIPSLALARVLKERDPAVHIVFGGAGCEGPMGETLLRAYACIDVVVRGEGEPVLPALVESLAGGRPVPRLSGLCYRDQGRLVAVPERTAPAQPMDEVPMPDYDEYFARLDRLGLRAELQPVLPFESARGCWWGEKSHCTFCGLNGQLMRHRSKSADRVVAELTALADRHAVLDFTAVDNILDLGYFASVLPQLAARGLDLAIFYQTKANLGRQHVRLLRAAGVRWVRPGIESLSTPILRRMRKGVSALQNIRLLKWCSQHDVHVAWNIIWGLPGESAEDYRRMAEVVPSLVHLSPPSLGPLTLDRFSPYASAPARYGIEVLGAPAHSECLHDVDEAARTDLAWTFAFRVAGLPEGDYTAALRRQVERWRADWHANRDALTFRRGPSFLALDDARTTTGRRRFVLDRVESLLYLGCEAGNDPQRLASAASRAAGVALDAAAVVRVLDQFVAERLMYEEDGRYLSLAVPADRMKQARAGVAAAARPPAAPALAPT